MNSVGPKAGQSLKKELRNLANDDIAVQGMCIK